MLPRTVGLGTISAVLLTAGCTGHANHVDGPVTLPTASPSPSALSSAVAQGELAAIPAGNEGTFGDAGPRKIVVTLRRASSLTFGCIGTGPLQLAYSVPAGAFRARCSPTSPTNFTTNVTLPRYPGRLTIRVQVEAGTVWRLALDTHLIEVENP